MYRALRPEPIECTVRALHAGLARHFPESGLSRVAAEVLEVASRLDERAHWIRPSVSLALRGSVGLVVLGVIGALAWLVPVVVELGGVRNLAEFMEAAESGFQLVLLLGAAIFFLVSLERRIIRRSALNAIAELRSLVHVVDMHQLRKGPEHLRTTAACTLTGVPEREVTELIRYLDYCSELLSLLSKMCAYYVQRAQDADVGAAVQEVQVVAIGLSQKVWQKVAILDQMAGSFPKRWAADRAVDERKDEGREDPDGDFGPGVSTP